MKKLSYSMLAVAVLSITVAQTNLSCDLVNDSCPSRFDGVCDSELGSHPKPDCHGGDCADCDQCPQYAYDCGGCVANGCYWCPSDATCVNSPNYHLNIFSECRAPGDFDQTCDGSSDTNSSFNFNFNSNFFQDPLYDDQSWVFDMIHVLPVWQQGIVGSSVRVRINDNGVDASHDEFGARFDEGASCYSFLPDLNDGPTSTSYHGTAVASILGAGANNGQCSVGIAPNVTISACNLLQYRTDSFLAEKVHDFDISQNSFGYPACGPGRRDLQYDNVCPFAYTNSRTTNPCTVCDFGDSSATAAPTSTSCQTAIVRHCLLNYEKDVPGCLQFLDLLLPGGRCDYNVLNLPAQKALAKGILQGRDGKGIIYVFASGNSFSFGDDTNFKGYTNSRYDVQYNMSNHLLPQDLKGVMEYSLLLLLPSFVRLVITVGSVGKDGLHASYSTPGASLFVTGPGGDHENVSNHMTANIGGGCRDAGVGTSFACPVVSGVVALILQANPEVTWRDVQGILATTSQMVWDDPYDTSRIVNAAGLSHSHYYGFGIVDANAAVEAAKTWELYATEKRLLGESGILNLAIVDKSSSYVMSTIQLIPNTDDFLVESVEVYVDLQHFSRGDLEIVLTSPHGTESILHPGNRPENSLLEEGDHWKLLTVRAWGESAKGDWTMVIRDISPGYALECADAPWTVLFDGLTLNCDYVQGQEFCIDGALDPTADPQQLDLLLSLRDHGRDIAEACCVCGGGLSTKEFVDQLRQWKIVVYGREIENPTIVPTKTPTNAPSNTIPRNNTPLASIELSLAPTQSPAPSSSPSLAPPIIPRQNPESFPNTNTIEIRTAPPASANANVIVTVNASALVTAVVTAIAAVIVVDRRSQSCR